MASTAVVTSLEDYLRTSYHPDCHFVDGAIEDRSLGELEHGRLQGLLAAWFIRHEPAWNIFTIVEQRIQVAPNRVRVADLCIVRRDAPREKVTVTPPLLRIEILSPEDRLPRAAKVMEDYTRLGVEHLWLFDPLDRIAYIYGSGGVFTIAEERLSIPATPIYVDLPTLFSGLSS